MRIVWTALLCGTLSLSGRVPAAAVISPLQECRLEHPLRIAAVAARCGILKVPEDPAHPAGATIDLRVAVVPALNRRSAAAPLFCWPEDRARRPRTCTRAMPAPSHA